MHVFFKGYFKGMKLLAILPYCLAARQAFPAQPRQGILVAPCPKSAPTGHLSGAWSG